MLKKSGTMLLLLCWMGIAKSQEVRINGYTSYVFDDRIDSYYDASSYYNGTIKGGWQYGLGLEYKVNPYYGVELMYLRLDTKAPIEYYSSGVKFSDFDLAVNHIMLGGKRYLSAPGSKVEGYGGALVGVNIMDIEDPKTGRGGSQGYFAWGVRLGADIWLNDKIALKLQTQMISSAQSVGGGLYFGTGGLSTGLSSYSSIYQFNMGGGLVFKLQ